MFLMIVYTNDGEMNTESSEFFIEEVLKKIPYFNELKHTVRHNADDKDSAVITIKNIDRLRFTKEWLEHSKWDDRTVCVLQKDFKELLELSRNAENLCPCFWTIFNACGAEMYLWGE